MKIVGISLGDSLDFSNFYIKYCSMCVSDVQRLASIKRLPFVQLVSERYSVEPLTLQFPKISATWRTVLKIFKVLLQYKQFQSKVI